MFNIVTPTFNRKHTLHRVYDSLLKQTEKRFNWIIIDDCSTDSTAELVAQWIHESKIDIQYHKLPVNQGKGIAVNFGLDHCHKPYTIIADSDDSFDANTLSDLISLWDTINLTQTTTRIASIWTLTKTENNTFVGDKFPKDLWQVGFEERVLKNTIEGEKWACWRTEVLSKYKLYADSQCYIGESHTWNRINRDHDFLCVNMAHRCYYDSADGIMATKNSRKKIARMKYLSSFFGLKDIPLKDIISYKYYRFLAFEYILSQFHFSDQEKKLSTTKTLVSSIIFLIRLPKRVFNKLT